MKHCHPGFFSRPCRVTFEVVFVFFFMNFHNPPFDCGRCCQCCPLRLPLLPLLLLLAGSKPPLSHAEIHFYEYKEFWNVQIFSVFRLKSKKMVDWGNFFKYRSRILKRSLNIALTKIKEESVSHFWF